MSFDDEFGDLSDVEFAELDRLTAVHTDGTNEARDAAPEEPLSGPNPQRFREGWTWNEVTQEYEEPQMEEQTVVTPPVADSVAALPQASSSASVCPTPDALDPAQRVDRSFVCPIYGHWTHYDHMYCALTDEADDPSWCPKDHDTYEITHSCWITQRVPFECVGWRERPPHNQAIAGTSMRAWQHRVIVQDWRGREIQRLRGYRLQCEQCGESALERRRKDEEKAEWIARQRREWQEQQERDLQLHRRQEGKRKRNAEKEAQKRSRLAASGALDDDCQKLRGLKVEALKRVCAANAFLVTGKKDELIERLLACKQHGRLDLTQCPKCRDQKFNLEFAPDGMPIRVECRHWNKYGRQCGFLQTWDASTKAAVLSGKLRDSADRDLRGVGLSDLEQ